MAADKDIIFGIRPVIEAISSSQYMDKVLVQRNLKSEQFPRLNELLTRHNVPYQVVPIEKLNRITRKNHQGVIAFTSPIEFQSIEKLLPLLYEQGHTPFLLILDSITDVRNFGAIVRTAECAGVNAIIIPEKGAAQISSDAVKTSAGALFKVPICRESSLKTTIQFLQESGLQVIACTEKANELIYDCTTKDPVALIIGGEENGIHPEVIKTADQLVKLPLAGKIGSLNVSVAAGIALYEIVRQRGSK